MRDIKVDSSKVILQYSLYSRIRTLLLVMLALVIAGIFIAIEVTIQQASPLLIDVFTTLKINLLLTILPLLLISLVISKLVLDKLVFKPFEKLQQKCHDAIADKDNHHEPFSSPYIELDGLVNLLNDQIETMTEPRVNKILLAQSKQQFVESLSNDIRTPMNSILGTAELLCEMPQNIKSAEYLKLMKHSANHMQMVLNDVTDYSRIESGNLELGKVRFDLLEILDQVYTSLRPFVHNNLRVRFSLNYSDDLHRFYIGDPVRLQQVLVNLVANALKFTDRGFVELKVNCSKIDDTNEEGVVADIVFTISDTGIGIPVTKLAHLFDNEQLPYNHKSNDLPSGGLSLAICSRLINLMQGRLQVESKLGEGAQFKINLRLPHAYQLRRQHIIGSSDLALDKLAGLKVLLIEDNKMNQIVFQQALRQLHMQVFTANTGLEGLDLIQKYTFDIIYMQIPGPDGIATTKMVRAGTSDNSKTPIIALIEDAFKFDLVTCKHIKMDGYINKPISKQALIDETVRVLGFEIPVTDVVLPINKECKVSLEE
ncbi:hybrid sensor histidine kinase/response regulator [Moritella viscosa]|uniref:histidine kinase n=1 Tax=Moritella viscosa TaxID=80854 RepID=A0A1L0A1H7_9GAMM|nr:ATP-binding protein [Moritella viscosa]SGZ06126.1 Response regulator receiver:ATP-binding region,ATPase-like:Histidine kinase, HAMP region:Histidine [Moritella viscosa]SHO09113.1 Response regulator receiver:ATP-binding region,ATPase-like:Histidine kinase, HAMP region:Histidine [Moritella viscosa]SHO09176.1 Response regulator receiver:ATP-binding region,ATPase-like:Histidine kinase, HAMP region:Histidine [Moritella viscosa]SHO13876.1 Response regulator receiver:ATP-binding region,ATPase-like: